jgi:thiosulfate reductase cytochrome b subunit
MNFSNKTLRNTLRAIHLVVAALVGAYIYSPLGNMEWFAVLVRASVLPALLISGLSMWQMPWLTKMIKRQPVPVRNEI